METASRAPLLSLAGQAGMEVQRCGSHEMQICSSHSFRKPLEYGCGPPIFSTKGESILQKEKIAARSLLLEEMHEVKVVQQAIHIAWTQAKQSGGLLQISTGEREGFREWD